MKWARQFSRTVAYVIAYALAIFFAYSSLGGFLSLIVDWTDTRGQHSYGGSSWLQIAGALVGAAVAIMYWTTGSRLRSSKS